MKTPHPHRVALAAFCCLVATPAVAQTSPPADETAEQIDQETPRTVEPIRPGRPAESPVGEVGRRQSDDRPLAGIDPLARVSTRIQNRVQTRIRNRIDRDYDPQANATSSFAVASDQARIAGPAARR